MLSQKLSSQNSWADLHFPWVIVIEGGYSSRWVVRPVAKVEQRILVP